MATSPGRPSTSCAARGLSAMASLLLWKARKPWQVPWTEYSLYTSAAEINGTLYDYHAEWDTCYTSDVHLFSEQSCVWGADDFERLVRLPNGTDPGGKFIIVQSHARIPLQQVRDYCLSFAGLRSFDLPLCSPIFGAFSSPPARSPSMLSGRPWNRAFEPA